MDDGITTLLKSKRKFIELLNYLLYSVIIVLDYAQIGSLTYD